MKETETKPSIVFYGMSPEFLALADNIGSSGRVSVYKQALAFNSNALEDTRLNPKVIVFELGNNFNEQDLEEIQNTLPEIRLVGTDMSKGQLTLIRHNKRCVLPIQTLPYELNARSSTHKFLTKQGLVILRNDMGADLVESIFPSNKVNMLLDGSTEPDTDQTDGHTFAGHFINYSSKKNYLGFDCPTALTNFMIAYSNALAECTDPTALGWEFILGAALHYFQDATAPFHAANDPTAVSGDFDHSKFETFAETCHDDYMVNHSELYGVAQNKSLDELLLLAAHWAYDTYERYNLTKNKNQWKQGAEEGLKNAQKWVAAILYRFMMDSKLITTRGIINVALGKPASQSSIYKDVPSLGPTRYVLELDQVGCAAKAVDGSADGNFFANTVTHTNCDNRAWWQVDLQSMYTIGRIEIYNRTDGYMDRLRDFTLIILNQDHQEVWSRHQVDYPNPFLNFSVPGILGRYVKVQLNGANYLHLAEVKVFEIT